MKKILFLSTLVMSMLLTSCGSDEPDQGGGGDSSKKKVTSITKNYKLTITSDLKNLSDVKVKYVDGDNNVVTENVTGTSWSKNVDINLSRATTDATAGMVLDCDNHGAAADGTTYQVGYTEEVGYTLVYSDGSSRYVPIFNVTPRQPNVDGREVNETLDAVDNSSAVSVNLPIGQSGTVNPQPGDVWTVVGDQTDPTIGQGYFASGNDDDAVDLGFGDILWSTRNVGAQSPTDVGGLYGWGDPFGQLTEALIHYYPSRNPSSVLTGNTLSGTRMDIAYAQWGNGWRMPRSSEWSAMKENCSFKYEKVNGQPGLMVTSNINGNQIFLPANGDRHGTMHRNFTGDNPYGYYWSGDWCSTTDASRAWMFYFSGMGNVYPKQSNERYFGLSIRPVRPKSIPLPDREPIIIN